MQALNRRYSTEQQERSEDDQREAEIDALGLVTPVEHFDEDDSGRHKKPSDDDGDPRPADGRRAGSAAEVGRHSLSDQLGIAAVLIVVDGREIFEVAFVGATENPRLALDVVVDLERRISVAVDR